MTFLSLFFSWIIVSSFSSPDGEIVGSVKVDQENIQLGKPFTIQLEVSYPESTIFSFDEAKKNLLSTPTFPKSFILLDEKKEKIERGTKISYLLLPEKEGPLSLSFLNLSFSNPETKKEINLFTDPFTIKTHLGRTISPTSFVEPGLSTQFSLRDVYLAQEGKFRQEEGIVPNLETTISQKLWEEQLFPWFTFISILVVSSLIVFFPWFLKTIKKFWKEKMILSFSEKIISEIEKTRQEFSNQKLSVDESYIKVINLLRSCIEKEYGIQAPYQTTEEFLLKMKAKGNIPEHLQRNFSEFFIKADKVKFAGKVLEKELFEKAVSLTKELASKKDR